MHTLRIYHEVDRKCIESVTIDIQEKDVQVAKDKARIMFKNFPSSKVTGHLYDSGDMNSSLADYIKI